MLIDPHNRVSLSGKRLEISTRPTTWKAHDRLVNRWLDTIQKLEGRSHEVTNLTIADASILPGCPSVAIGLTVIANALRIAERLKGDLA